MRYLIITFVFFSVFTSIFSQQVVQFYVKDSVTEKPLPFAKIIVLEKKKGTYSNSEGFVQMNNLDNNSRILIEYIGYYSKNVLVSQVAMNSSIMLSQKETQLKTVNIRSEKITKLEVGYSKKKAVSNSLWSCINVGNELAVLIKNNKETNAFIDKIIFKVKRIANNNPLLRIHLYKNENNKPGREIFFKNNIITINSNKVIVNVENDYLTFPKEGIFVSIEWLGKYRIEEAFYNDTSLVLNPKIKAVRVKKFTAFHRLWKKQWEIFPESIPIPAIGLIIEKYDE